MPDPLAPDPLAPDPLAPDPLAPGPEFAAIAAALRRLCKHPLPDLAPDTYLDELPGMDSLRVLHVIAALEDGFGVELDVAALDAMRQVQDILHAVQAAQRAASSAG